MERSTKVKCKVCEGVIVEKIESEATVPEELIPAGCDPAKYFHEVSKGFYCKNCGTKYELTILL